MTSDQFRKMALEIPKTVERTHMNHPDFRVAGKIFASLGVPDENWGMAKLTPKQQRAFVEKAPEVFNPCKGAWGAGKGIRMFILPPARRRLCALHSMRRPPTSLPVSKGKRQTSNVEHPTPNDSDKCGA
jgi:hypothetical protein